MKQTLLIAALSIATLSVNAQTRTDFLGISGGAAIPTGGFAATNSDYYNKAGYATTGGSFSINYVHRFNNWFGLAISTFDAQNSVSTSKLLAVSQSSDMDVRRLSGADALLVGGMFKKADFPIYAKAMVGFGAVQSAELRFYDDNSGYVQTIQQSDPTFGFAYSVGIGAMFPISYHWALTLSADFVSVIAKPSTVSYDNSGYAPQVNPSFSYNQNFVNAQIGIGYVFGPNMGRMHRQRPPMQQQSRY